MFGAMSKKKPSDSRPKGQPTERGPVLYMRLTLEDEAALQAFIAAQIVPPERPAVGLKGLRELLRREGYLPAEKK